MHRSHTFLAHHRPTTLTMPYRLRSLATASLFVARIGTVVSSVPRTTVLLPTAARFAPVNTLTIIAHVVAMTAARTTIAGMIVVATTASPAVSR